MFDIQERAHDLALSYINNKLSAEHDGTDPELDEENFFNLYKESYDAFFTYLSEGI